MPNYYSVAHANDILSQASCALPQNCLTETKQSSKALDKPQKTPQTCDKSFPVFFRKTSYTAEVLITHLKSDIGFKKYSVFFKYEYVVA